MHVMISSVTTESIGKEYMITRLIEGGNEYKNKHSKTCQERRENLKESWSISVTIRQGKKKRKKKQTALDTTDILPNNKMISSRNLKTGDKKKNG